MKTISITLLGACLAIWLPRSSLGELLSPSCSPPTMSSLCRQRARRVDLDFLTLSGAMLATAGAARTASFVLRNTINQFLTRTKFAGGYLGPKVIWKAR